MNPAGMKIAEAYANGSLSGWAEPKNPGIAMESFNLLSEQGIIVPFGTTFKDRPKKVNLRTFEKRLLGNFIDDPAQEDSDCVSQGAKNAVQTLTCVQILGLAAMSANPAAAIASARIKWRPVYAPYYHGTGRVYVGNGQLGRGGGSFGSWMAAAVLKYGTLFRDEPGVPTYSGRMAQLFGNDRKTLDKWLPTAKAFPVKSTAKVNTLDQIRNAIASGYPVTTASSIGYSMTPNNKGFHVQNARWDHQMYIFGYGEDYFLIGNSWSDVHGHLKDFDTGEDLPTGTLRVKDADMQKHLGGDGENYAFSEFEGFPDQSALLEKALFMLI